MKAILIFLMLLSATLTAQDKVYFLSGEITEGKILEINPEDIILQKDDQSRTILKNEVLLIEFKSGHIEQISKPEKNVVFNTAGTRASIKPALASQDNLNRLSVNTLAFVNADISLFYERISRNKTLGYGVMGAYNFNKYVLQYNVFLFILSNAKKKMDAGAFINYYPGQLKRKKNLYLGILLKYTSFDFSYLHEDTVWNGGQSTINVRYTPASGYQLATIFTMGSHYHINQKLFIKTIYGLGGFILRGDYYDQMNYILNQGSDPDERVNVSFLPKLYLGINLGYNF